MSILTNLRMFFVRVCVWVCSCVDEYVHRPEMLFLEGHLPPFKAGSLLSLSSPSRLDCLPVSSKGPSVSSAPALRFNKCAPSQTALEKDYVCMRTHSMSSLAI